MKNIIIIIALALSGCATFKTQGISVYDKQADTNLNDEQIRLLISDATDVLNVKGYLKARQVKNWHFVYTSAWLGIPIPGTDDIILADGLTDVEMRVTYIKVHKDTCWAESSTLHELAHVVQYLERGIEDRHHTNKEFWKDIDQWENMLLREYCGYNYKRKHPRMQ